MGVPRNWQNQGLRFHSSIRVQEFLGGWNLLPVSGCPFDIIFLMQKSERPKRTQTCPLDEEMLHPTIHQNARGIQTALPITEHLPRQATRFSPTMQAEKPNEQFLPLLLKLVSSKVRTCKRALTITVYQNPVLMSFAFIDHFTSWGKGDAHGVFFRGLFNLSLRLSPFSSGIGRLAS